MAPPPPPPSPDWLSDRGMSPAPPEAPPVTSLMRLPKTWPPGETQPVDSGKDPPWAPGDPKPPPPPPVEVLEHPAVPTPGAEASVMAPGPGVDPTAAALRTAFTVMGPAATTMREAPAPVMRTFSSISHEPTLRTAWAEPVSYTKETPAGSVGVSLIVSAAVSIEVTPERVPASGS